MFFNLSFTSSNILPHSDKYSWALWGPAHGAEPVLCVGKYCSVWLCHNAAKLISEAALLLSSLYTLKTSINSQLSCYYYLVPTLTRKEGIKQWCKVHLLTILWYFLFDPLLFTPLTTVSITLQIITQNSQTELKKPIKISSTFTCCSIRIMKTV